MTEESVVVICPNPKCGKEIREPMLLTILCVTPPEQYEACPYCFAKLQPEDYPQETEAPELEQNEETDLEEAEPEQLDDESDEEDEEDFETDESEDDEESEPKELADESDEDEEDFEAEESNYDEEDDYEDILPKSDVQEKVKESGPSFLQRVKSLIPSSNESKKEKAVEHDSVSAVEPEEELEDEDEEDSYEEEDEFEDDDKSDETEDEEDFETDEPEDDEEEDEPEEDEPKAIQSVNTERKKDCCPEAFGYLANREKDVPIPAVCYMCPRMVDCMLSPRDY